MSGLKKFLSVYILTVIFVVNGTAIAQSDVSIASPKIRSIVYSLVSSAENSTLNYGSQYSYIEDIDDGRGYTAGIIGFTTNTGDLLEVIKKYTQIQPVNVLAKYIPALEKLVGTDSHEGLSGFYNDWKFAARSLEMKQAQDAVVEEMYLNPAIDYARRDGLSLLGQYIYYDALVMHGPGDDAESFGGIRWRALQSYNPPSRGGNEAKYLETFLRVRVVVMQREEVHADLSRIETQRKFIREGKFNLELPLSWTMYGDNFYLRSVKNFY